jgi:hypothetical protein
MIEKGTLWLSVLNAREKSVLLRRHGRWLVNQTRVAKEQSLPLDCMSVAVKNSDQS